MILLIAGCNQNVSPNTEDTNLIEKDTSMSGINEISYEQLQEKLQEDSNFILYIGRPDCPDCAEFYPIVEAHLADNEGMYIYYLNVKSFRDASRREDASEEEIAFFENIREELSFDWTPTLHFYVGNEIEATYTYLDRDFHDIEEEEKQEERKQEFVDAFEIWINEKFK